MSTEVARGLDPSYYSIKTTVGLFILLRPISYDYPIQAATTGLPSHTISMLLQMRQSHITHTVRYGIALVAILGSISIAFTGTENTCMTLTFA
jgi:hypothetical protein